MTNNSTTTWETDIVALLDELSSVQDELLDVLRLKQQAIAAGDLEAIEQLSPREQQLAERLETVHQQRGDLLAHADRHGLPGDSITQLAAVLPNDLNSNSSTNTLSQRVAAASDRSNELRHQSLSSWVLAQRALLHVSQMLQILAGGGEIQPTYTKGAPAAHRGALVDEAA